MLSRVSCWRLCSIRNMFYTPFLISLCVALLVWTLDIVHDLTKSSINFFTPSFKPNANTKYILSWDHKYLTSIVTDSFQKFNCSEKNCVFTTNKGLLYNLGGLRAFNAVVFGEDMLSSDSRPKQSPRQIFVFMSFESSYHYPACELYNENYFNWTFTYRFDSDLLWRHFVVRDSSGNIVAPSTQVVWTKSSDPVRPQIRNMLRSKMRAVAWIVNDCSAESYDYLLRLEKHLYHFGLKLDKYKRFQTSSICREISAKNYQFVLAFENSMVEDHISKRVMDGYRNYAVPIVYGGANYSRLLPPGSYINAYEVHPYNLAQAIDEASKNQHVFESYFTWTNVYSIEEWGTEHSSLCDLCAALHVHRTRDFPAKKKFRVWWNSPNSMHRCLPTDYLNIEKKYHYRKKNVTVGF